MSPPLILSILLMFVFQIVVSRQVYRSYVPNGQSIPCNPGQEENCIAGVCEGFGHVTCRGGGDRNSFGKDFEKEGYRWTKKLCELDSDGDGASNGLELGDPCCLFDDFNADLFPQSYYGLSHPGDANALPLEAPEVTEEYCANIQSIIDDRSENRFTEMFGEGEERKYIDFRILNYTVPAKPTTYAYPRYSFPIDDKYDIVAIEPIINEESADLVHHFTVSACSLPWDGEDGFVEFESEGGGDYADECQEVTWAWEPGVKTFIGPPGHGYHSGSTTTRLSFTIEMHYDNPFGKVGVVDTSGVRMHFTRGHRSLEYGFIFAGPGLNINAIPAGEKQYYLATMIPVSEINETFAPDGVKIFNSLSHAHNYGRRIFSAILREEDFEVDEKGDVRILGFNESNMFVKSNVDITPTYSFNNQKTVPVSGAALENGDYLAVGCIYDTTSTQERVTGGWGSWEEMCYAILGVYPMEAFNLDGFTIPRFSQTYWAGRVVHGPAADNALSIPSMGVASWVDYQSEWDRLLCPSNTTDELNDFNTTEALLQDLCGFPEITEKIETGKVEETYFPIANAFGEMKNCSEECGMLLSESLACLARRYGEVEYMEEGWSLKHNMLPEVRNDNDLFYNAYWWALYHNFPLQCDEHLTSFILAEFEEAIEDILDTDIELFNDTSIISNSSDNGNSTAMELMGSLFGMLFGMLQGEEGSK
eukprot:TRINITY_DN1990_c0_g1_i2.p1 TRINITY_DN1990_c0_g1~~TRINITY_DN1990_c0_g1_i2.p1  ORF type:complete len:703 (-),score=115.73 TRINITY_DN1990_c0_g1_i2:488-2596(-)